MRQRLVYTSAGPRHQVHRWLRGRATFDVWVTAYDESARDLEQVADGWNRRPGSKWQNLHALHTAEPALLEPYDHVLVLDDDILMTGRDIERLFAEHENRDLSISQPAFLPESRITHPVTRCQPHCRLRFTNFVEVNAPLVRGDVLRSFLGEYDGELVGWGIDHWLCDHARRHGADRFAVVDDVPCINPRQGATGGVGAVDTLQAREDRKAAWRAVADARGIPSLGGETLSCVPNTPGRRAVVLARWSRSQAVRAARRLRRRSG